MTAIDTDTRAAWTVDELTADPSWIFPLDDRAARDLAETVQRAQQITPGIAQAAIGIGLGFQNLRSDPLIVLGIARHHP